MSSLVCYHDLGVWYCVYAEAGNDLPLVYQNMMQLIVNEQDPSSIKSLIEKKM
jgi:hypothetical protein